MKRLVTTLEVELGIELTPDALDHMIDQSDGVETRPGIETTSVPTVQENLSLVEPSPRPDDRAPAGDPTRPVEAAAIIATSGRTATQTARVFYSVHFDTETIRDALLAPQDDPEQPTLFPAVEVCAALLTVASPTEVDALMPPTTQRDDIARQLRDDRLDDLRLIPTSSPTEPRTRQDRSTRLRPRPVTRADDQCLRNHRRDTATLGGDRYRTARR